mmetsp:Transcript_6308/g.9564  ORF Transcript_6308/g.9564 Transcript_6308/m.9564 type:complete len:203 (-) Transcript_6308:253-861(-)
MKLLPYIFSEIKSIVCPHPSSFAQERATILMVPFLFFFPVAAMLQLYDVAPSVENIAKNLTKQRPSSLTPAPRTISTFKRSPRVPFFRTSRTAARTTESARIASSGFNCFAKLGVMSILPSPSPSVRLTGASDGADIKRSITSSNPAVDTSFVPIFNKTSPGTITPLSAAAPPSARVFTTTPFPSSSRSSRTMPNGFVKSMV